MHIKLRCPKCEAALKVPTELSGKKGRCPKCQTAVLIPAIAQRTQEAVRPAPIAPPTIVPPPPSFPKADMLEMPDLDFGAQIAQPQLETSDMRRRRLLESFTGEIEPVRKSLAYILALPLVAAFMILLPLVYLAMVAAVGYLVYFHAINHTGWLAYGGHSGRGIAFLALLYAGPIIVGVIVVAFMLKPLLAKPLMEGRIRSLTPQAEPILFDVVAKLCEIVGAPCPKRIDVDCQLNASARFRRGFLSFFGNDLVLTIGAPLLACLSAQQFVGVLAHEFGHFSQGTGLRLSYLIRSVNHWFARTVFERDQWDAWLSNTAQSLDLRISWIFMLGMLGVALSRIVLGILMMVGFFVSGVLLRQMEYDADRYEARVVGSDAFESTSKRLRTYGIAYQFAFKMFMDMARRGKYVNDLSHLMKLVHQECSPDDIQKIERDMLEEKTGLFASHPSDAARIAAAKREATPGVFRVKGSAAILVRHYGAITQNVTWDLLCALIGPHVKQSDLKPFVKEGAAE